MSNYRTNVTDKQQGDLERATDDSSIRIHHFDNEAPTTGETKAIGAYDLQAQGNTGGSSSDAVEKAGKVIGSHNDKAHRFDTPGRA